MRFVAGVVFILLIFFIEAPLWAQAPCSDLLQRLAKNKESLPSLDIQKASLEDVLTAFARGYEPDLSNREQRAAFQAYLKLLFGRPDVSLAQPDGRNPVDLVEEFQKKFPQIKKRKFLSVILDSKPQGETAPNTADLIWRSFFKDHLAKLKQIQAKFLKIDAHLGFWKMIFDEKDAIDEAFVQKLDQALDPLDRTQINQKQRLDRSTALLLSKRLQKVRDRMSLEGKDLTKISRALVDLIHLSSFLDSDLSVVLPQGDQDRIRESLENLLQSREEMSKDLGFSGGFRQWLGDFKIKAPSGLESNAALDSMIDQLSRTKDQKSGQNLVKTKRHLRQLSKTESGFRSCVGGDCSSRESFSEAFDPNYVYFTITDERGRSSGLLTVVLGKAKSVGKTIEVAFLDKIQNIQIFDLELAIDALRESLALDGISLISSTELGDHNGISNDESVKHFLSSKPWLSEEPVHRFQPHDHRFSFKHVHTRARQEADWRWVRPFREKRDFHFFDPPPSSKPFWGGFSISRPSRASL